ncbi:(2Fe-2S)-binding protein [Oceanobacillus sp. FSL W7-1309]|uniref:(2Fe-2S)-binding protein n=1 Tax=Oceanobacillus sp. FSL W7-1309 TaxID=2954539 RepID=UPI000BA7B84D|nr:pyridine nucleotide-disulfide oxidoreductase [Paenibacillus sp. 7884-2]
MAVEKTIVCRCEEVTLETIQDTVHQYACSSREVKLRTRAGMGYCGGRTCRNVIDQIVAETNKEPIKDEVQLSYRSPIRPATFAVLGGGKHDNEN